MPVGVYVNDGSGRDSYVNGACLTNAKRKGPKDTADFWPSPAEVRRNKRLAGEPLSLSSTLTSPVRSDASGLSPQSARGPTTSAAQLPQLPSHYVSPKRQLGLVTDSFAQRGSVTPRGNRGPTSSATMESEAMFAARTGRFALSREAPAATGKLPGLKLHQQIGILDEV